MPRRRPSHLVHAPRPERLSARRVASIRRPTSDNPRVTDGQPAMVFLGFGKYARADRIYALQPITDERRGSGRRTLVWVEGIAEPIVASRTERTILLDMGQRDAVGSQLLDQALALAERVVHDADRVGPMLRRSIKSEAGVDLDDLARRGRRLLEATGGDPDAQRLFDE